MTLSCSRGFQYNSLMRIFGVVLDRLVRPLDLGSLCWFVGCPWIPAELVRSCSLAGLAL